MKQNYIEKKAESQHREAINHAPTRSFYHLHEVKQKSIYRNDYLVGSLKQNTALAGRSMEGEDHCFGKAPPGPARGHPAAARGHPPAPYPLSSKRGAGVSQQKEFQHQFFNKNQNSIFTNI